MELFTVKTSAYIDALHNKKVELQTDKQEMNSLPSGYGYDTDRIQELGDEITELVLKIDLLQHYDEETLQVDVKKFKFIIGYED